MSDDPTAIAFFSPTYGEARQRFLASAGEIGAEIATFENPNKGPQGEMLATDVAAFGPANAKHVLFVCSGTHGVEGFTGSAIQLGLMRSLTLRLSEGGARVVMIHGINPFGFAWIRRFNEDSVDLNRNFFSDGQPFPANIGYERLAETICPQSLSTPAEIAALARLLLFALRFGMNATRKAVTGGQYSHPDGMFFGGRTPSWSAKTLREIVTRYGNPAANIVFLDIHTGLGGFADAEIILNSPKRSLEFQRALSIWGSRVKATKAGESVSADLSGTLKLGVQAMLPEAEVTAASIEFGTYPPIKMLRALRAENWLHHFGDRNSAQADRICGALLEAFNPNSERWRSEVWTKGHAAVDDALAWLSETA